MNKIIFIIAFSFASANAFACGSAEEGFQQNELVYLINRVDYTCDKDSQAKIKTYALYRCMGSPTYAVMENEEKTLSKVDSIELKYDGFIAKSEEHGDTSCSFK